MEFYLEIWLTKKTSEQEGVHNRWVEQKTVKIQMQSSKSRELLTNQETK